MRARCGCFLIVLAGVTCLSPSFAQEGVTYGVIRGPGRDEPPDPSQVPELIEELHATDPAARARAACALGRLRHKARPAVADLARLLADQDSTARRGAAFALYEIGATALDAAPELVRALEDESRDVRYFSTEALGRIGSGTPPGTAGFDVKSIVAALGTVLHDQAEDPGVRWGAALALGTYGPPALPELARSLDVEDDDLHCRVIHALGECGAGAAPHLVKVIHDGDQRRRAAAQQALGRIGLPAAETIAGLLNSPTSKARSAGVAAIRHMDSESIFLSPLVVGVLDSATSPGRREAALLLGTIGGAEAIYALERAAASGPPPVRAEALRSLGKLRAPASSVTCDLLVQALASDDQKTRSAAAWAWVEIDPRSAVPALMAEIESPDEDRRFCAVQNLGRAGPASRDVAPTLVRLLDQDTPRVRYAVIAALGTIDKAGLHVPVLSGLLRDPQYHLAAARALGEIGEAAAASSPMLALGLMEAAEADRRTLEAKARPICWHPTMSVYIDALARVAPSLLEKRLEAMSDDDNEIIRRITTVELDKLRAASTTPRAR